jgi:hypothetical protein
MSDAMEVRGVALFVKPWVTHSALDAYTYVNRAGLIPAGQNRRVPPWRGSGEAHHSV